MLGSLLRRFSKCRWLGTREPKASLKMNTLKNESLLEKRLSALQRLEAEITEKAQDSISRQSSFSHSDMYVLGALKRTLAQCEGFQLLIGARNFSCSAAILRIQIDTSMRISALRFVDDRNALCEKLLDGKALNKQKSSEGEKLTDAYLRKKLAPEYPWLDEVYKQTSGFIHLSMRHFFSSIARSDDETRMVYLQITGNDPKRPESDYYEIVDTFFEATKVAGTVILGFLLARCSDRRS